MSLAVVDIGNTSIKFGLWNPDFHIESLRSNLAGALEEWVRHNIEDVAFCTTRQLSEQERSMIEAAGWWELKYGVGLPISINYDTPETLGADRLALAVGAWKLYDERPVVVADSGTALTLDVMGRGGVFLGGNISPGLEMRLDSLHKYTSRLPRVNNTECGGNYFGTDTSSAIGAGCRYGLAYEADGAFRMARLNYGSELMVVTGGDGKQLFEDLKHMFGEDYPVEYNSELLAQGLKTAYEYNHE